MRKGSFSVRDISAHTTRHNARIDKPKYLIDDSSKNYYELIQSDEDFLKEAEALYKKSTGQKMQQKQKEALVKEVVISLKENQDERDVKKLFKALNEKFGGHELLELAVHRDEGYFEKDGIAYYPTKNILKKGNSWYTLRDDFDDRNNNKPKAEDFTQKVKISEFKKVYNYHAHAKFSMFDKDRGKTARMSKSDMSQRIKFVSDFLDLAYAPGQDRLTKKSVKQIKDEHFARELQKMRDAYKFRDMQKQITALENATTEQKKELHKLNSAVKNAKKDEFEAKYRALQEKLAEYTAPKKQFKELDEETVRNLVLEKTFFKNKISEAGIQKIVTYANQAIKQANAKILKDTERLEQKISAYKAQNQTLSDENRKKDKYIAELKKELSEAKEEISRLKAEIIDLKYELKQRSNMKERQATRKELNEKQRELNDKKLISKEALKRILEQQEETRKERELLRAQREKILKEREQTTKKRSFQRSR